MTLLEALRSNISDAHGVVLSDNHFEKALVDMGLDKTATYTSSYSTSIDKASINLYNIILGSGSLSEGGLSYSVDKNEVRKLKEELEVKLGIKNTRSYVRNARVW